MKNLLIVAVSTAIVLGSSMATAKSTITKSKINVSSQNDKAIALSLGKNSTASVGSVNIKNSKIKKSTINVRSKNKKAIALSLGKGSTASVGSATIQ